MGFGRLVGLNKQLKHVTLFYILKTQLKLQLNESYVCVNLCRALLYFVLSEYNEGRCW